MKQDIINLKLLSGHDTNARSIKAVIFCILALQFVMLFTFEFNWDEFLILDWVYDWSEGKIILPLQTIYLRFFVFLKDIPGNEIHQIIAARIVMFSFFLTTVFLIFLTAKRFFSIKGALFAVLAYISFSYVFRNGASFRMDTMATSLLMFVVWSATHPNLKIAHALLGGFAFGLAGMITIKSVFYAPTIAAILLIRWGYSRWSYSLLFKSIVFGVSSLTTFAILYVVHSASLTAGLSGATYLDGVLYGSLLKHGLFPQFHIMLKATVGNMAFSALLLYGLFVCASNAWEKKQDNEKWLISLALTLPLISLAFYLHAFHYYYAFLLAPACIVVAAAYEQIVKVRKSEFPILLIALAITFLPTAWKTIDQSNFYQRQTVDNVHKIFPEPTAFIDRAGMISSFEQKGFFMATWQMREYYLKNQPIMENILIEGQPKFIVANVEGLDLDKLGPGRVERRLLRDDAATLTSNFIHHWDKLYILGKRLDLTPESATKFNILVPGTYTVEAQGTVLIDGNTYQNSQTIDLNAGEHLASTRSAVELILRWGDNLYKPEEKPLGEKLFIGF